MDRNVAQGEKHHIKGVEHGWDRILRYRLPEEHICETGGTGNLLTPLLFHPRPDERECNPFFPAFTQFARRVDQHIDAVDPSVGSDVSSHQAARRTLLLDPGNK